MRVLKFLGLALAACGASILTRLLEDRLHKRPSKPQGGGK